MNLPQMLCEMIFPREPTFALAPTVPSWAVEELFWRIMVHEMAVEVVLASGNVVTSRVKADQLLEVGPSLRSAPAGNSTEW